MVRVTSSGADRLRQIVEFGPDVGVHDRRETGVDGGWIRCDDLRMNLRPGMNIDGWVLVSPLGCGGNGEVWRSTHSEFGEAALKVLTSRKGDRWQRFCDEVQVMEKLGARPGILPLIASKLPAPPSRAQAWLATPIAEPVVEALGAAPSLTAVVDAVLAFASTLAGLSAEGISHRDIKPDNLFRRGGQWQIGDFGLVDYPGKNAVTTGDRRLGPLYFIAPEMLLQPDLADSGPADVYSLAKTLWVLASGQRYPPQGQVRPDVASHDLAAWVNDSGTIALGVILQSATDESPDARQTMAEFADQLREWRRGDPLRDDRAEEDIRLYYVRSLGEQLAKTVNPQAFSHIEAELREVMGEARRQSADKQREVLRDSLRRSETSRRAFIDDYGIKAALDLHDSPWVGSIRDGDDFEYAVLNRAPDERQGELHRARQILWGRPLWWIHSVALAGTLKLRGRDGCEPLATELAAQEVRDHLLEFADHPTLAAVWRLQRAFVGAG